MPGTVHLELHDVCAIAVVCSARLPHAAACRKQRIPLRQMTTVPSVLGQVSSTGGAAPSPCSECCAYACRLFVVHSDPRNRQARKHERLLAVHQQGR